MHIVYFFLLALSTQVLHGESKYALAEFKQAKELSTRQLQLYILVRALNHKDTRIDTKEEGIIRPSEKQLSIASLHGLISSQDAPELKALIQYLHKKHSDSHLPALVEAFAWLCLFPFSLFLFPAFPDCKWEKELLVAEALHQNLLQQAPQPLTIQN